MKKIANIYTLTNHINNIMTLRNAPIILREVFML